MIAIFGAFLIGLSSPLLDPSSGGGQAAAQENTVDLVEATNIRRKEGRLRPLRYEPRLGLIARQIAEAFARGRDESIPISEVEGQLRRQGYAFQRTGYVVGFGSDPAPVQVDKWISQSRRDRGLLDAGFAEIGSAVVDGRKFKNGTDDLVWVLLLADPTRPAAPGWERAVLRHVNEFRAKRGLPTLELNSLLSRSAQAHAEDMAVRDYFAHDSLEGRTAGDRARRAGYKFQYWRENLAAGMERPDEVVSAWIKSRTGHREAMLDPLMKEAGIGYMFLPQDGGRVQKVHYWAMTLASPG